MLRDALMSSGMISAAAAFLLVAQPQVVGAQGCEPIRFTTPVSLGGQDEALNQPGRGQGSMAVACCELSSRNAAKVLVNKRHE